jgi:methionine-gamma-lyase
MSDPYRTQIAGHDLSPESLMMGYGYKPEWSEGALKSPIFQTSTFAFTSAAEGKHFFALTHGLVDPVEDEPMGLIYSRINNPDLEILEHRLTLWDGADQALVFASGMAAITTTLLSFVAPGSVLVHTAPLYGGTDHFVRDVLPRFGVDAVEWHHGMTVDDVTTEVGERPLAAVLMETPANPTNCLFSIADAKDLAERFRSGTNPVPVLVDNTFLGPLFQHPLNHGADIVLYSATKYIGGHSDLIAGAALGSTELMAQVAEMRTTLGTMATPHTGWLIMRSLETLALRMTRQMENAQKVADFLASHPKVDKIAYLGLLVPDDDGYDVYTDQCEGPGSMISIWIDGGEEEAFRFLDALQLAHLAVSLGSTETLLQHPASMTHAGVDPEVNERFEVNDALVRLSIGVEDPDDIIADISNALEAI